MTIQMSRTGPSLSDNQIRDFEVSIACSLPSDFRLFLLKYNGGQPTPCLIDIEQLPGSSSDVQMFFGLERSVKASDLLWNARQYVGRVRNGLCPIACDSGGNLYCLSLLGDERGAVYYEDMMEPEIKATWYGSPEPEERQEYRVASTFDEFIRKLRE